MTDDDTQALTVMMTEVSTKIQVLLDKQDELADNISKIKEAVYHPDKGLYARLSRLDARLDQLEMWKNANAQQCFTQQNKKGPCFGFPTACKSSDTHGEDMQWNWNESIQMR